MGKPSPLLGEGVPVRLSNLLPVVYEEAQQILGSPDWIGEVMLWLVWVLGGRVDITYTFMERHSSLLTI